MVALSFRFDQGGTNMRIIGRYALCVAVTVALSGFLFQPARADALYSVTNLGAANPSSSYLSALSQIQQASFQAGSFDSYAHPATVGNLPAFISNGGTADIAEPYNGNDQTVFTRIYMTTSNNLGVNAGTANTQNSAWGGNTYTQAVTFTPDPHTVSVPNSSQPGSTPTPESSPGFLNMLSTTTSNIFNQFIGSIAGINDQTHLALTESIINSSGQQIQSPRFYSPSGDVSLGSLGGLNGVANALNNSNQVVGWSQIASGAQHAFLYSNGTMQDLNLLIPPLSGITLTSAVGIDSAGEIVAFGTDPSGKTNEYFLTPLESQVPEPSTLAIMGLMIVAVAARQAYSRRQTKS
jgi:probable HAF family extracellular repeat protein